MNVHCIFIYLPASFFNYSFHIPDVTYGYVIDQQPIGRILFRLFCENKKPIYHRYIAFLDNVTRWEHTKKRILSSLTNKRFIRYEIEYDENRLKIGRDIGKRFLGIDFFDEDSENGEPEVLDNSTDTTANNENTISKCNLSGEKDELVLDVLNDDLISKVREKITRKIDAISFFLINFIQFVVLCCRWM